MTLNIPFFIFKRIMHFKCRLNPYPRSENVFRFTVPDDKVEWSVSWDLYKPTIYNSPHILGASWADPDLPSELFNPKWNKLDGNVNRESYVGVYDLHCGLPQNPCGRTGLTGRGCLGRWGPNHAADPIVTRWKISPSGDKTTNSKTHLPVLQFVAINRKDCGQWAIPGGMVDPGELISTTLQREFSEEALNSLERSVDCDKIKSFFTKGHEVYRGYVDDPRNTDNAWMETVAVNFHDDDGTVVGRFPLEAGDDAQKVTWMDVDASNNLYASHKDILQQVASLHSAHW